MGYNLVIAEKPSVAQAIAKVLGATNKFDGYLEGSCRSSGPASRTDRSGAETGYLVSWCVGHLVELAEPEEYDGKYEKWRKEDLPIIPSSWEYQVSLGTKKQYQILKELLFREDVDCVTNACDAGREGELIFRLVYDKAKCKKPIKRLWISSMEDEAIINGFENLRDGKEYEALYEAALCRERADWIIGINATRFFSTLYGQTLNVGRVMTPTLALAVEREASIRAFKPESFYMVILNCNGVSLSSERMNDKEKAENLSGECSLIGQVLIVDASKIEKQEKAPALFDLTNLQREANRRLGYTAQQTLDYTQSLYEKKLVSYPRTDSRFLTEDMEGTIPGIIDKAEKIVNSKATENKNIMSVINGKKVTDHHAIIPTASVDKANLEELPSGEREVLRLIATRLLEAVSEPCRYMETVIDADCNGHQFKAKGKQIINLGWKGIAPVKNMDKDGDENTQEITANINAGQMIKIDSTECKEGKTSAPKSFTEDTILSSMEKAGADETPDEAERKGLGTPATRAGIIEKLVRTGFIERRGDKKTKYLVPTHKGEALITVVPEAIQSASMTAEWEQKLIDIEKKNYSSEQFMQEIENLIATLIDTYEVIPDAEVLMHPVYMPLGKCPHCGKDVIEKSKGFFCSDKECKFALWKENRLFDSLSKKMTKQIAEQLLKNGRVKLKKCRSVKTGKTYDCTVVLSVNDVGQAQFNLEFGDQGRK